MPMPSTSSANTSWGIELGSAAVAVPTQTLDSRTRIRHAIASTKPANARRSDAGGMSCASQAPANEPAMAVAVTMPTSA